VFWNEKKVNEGAGVGVQERNKMSTGIRSVHEVGRPCSLQAGLDQASGTPRPPDYASECLGCSG
jgi:hypothetical protein